MHIKLFLQQHSLAPAIFLLVLVSACSDEVPDGNTSDTAVSVSIAAALKPDPVRYTNGLKLYQQTCATCHGAQGEGAAGWQQRDKDGKFLAPPLNGSGHTWHHPEAVLLDIINNGTERLGGNMPAWKESLSHEEIQDILFWITSQWDREIYQIWYENNLAVQHGSQ